MDYRIAVVLGFSSRLLRLLVPVATVGLMALPALHA